MKIVITLFFTVLSLMAIEPLVDSQWLSNHQNDKGLRIVEVSDGDSYQFEHINGALHTSIDAWRFNNGTFISVRSVKEIEKEISRLGIDETSDVVLYAPINKPKDLLKATYVYWALNYHGVKNVALLDGGLASYKSADLPLSSEAPRVRATIFKAEPDKRIIADLDYVKKNARPSDMYLGVTPTPTVKRDGHIQGAMNYSWNYSVDKDYLLKPKTMLESIFKDGYRLDKDKEVLVYCTGGLETSFNYFVLSGILGYKHVRLYDASMKEWGNRDDTPMSRYGYEIFNK